MISPALNLRLVGTHLLATVITARPASSCVID